MAERSILFAVRDKMRLDCLGCTGHPAPKTPTCDGRAARGGLANAHCRSPVCSTRRMSIYVGRYVSSNGAASNHAPPRSSERDSGDSVKPPGMRANLLEAEPSEILDLGRKPARTEIRDEIYQRLSGWALQYRRREAWSDPLVFSLTEIEEGRGASIRHRNEPDLADPANALRFPLRGCGRDCGP